MKTRSQQNPVNRKKLRVKDSGNQDDSSTKCATSVNDLPTEIVLRVLTYLPHQDLVKSASRVNKRWHQLCADHDIWRRKVVRVRNRAELNNITFFTQWITILDVPRLTDINVRTLCATLPFNRHLQILKISANDIMPANALFFKGLRSCASLRCLLIRGRCGGYESPFYFEEMLSPKMVEVRFGVGRKTAQQSVENLIRGCPNLQSVCMLPANRKFRPEVLKTLLCSTLPINKLSIGVSNTSVSLDLPSYPKFITSMNRLEKLCICSVTLQASNLEVLLKYSINLKAFELQQNKYCFSQEANIIKLAPYMAKLQHLSLIKTSFRDVGLSVISKTCGNLKYMKVTSRELSAAGIASFVKSLRNQPTQVQVTLPTGAFSERLLKSLRNVKVFWCYCCSPGIQLIV